ncbi:ABC transporter permease [Clostridium massiliamazoniense]|uniref:ABC transporter permease n=1 Tax=Clostridium massiliamazoniense TaxID=1347366 RepID=UPI0006D7D4FE|nr:ABC transporter permease [Clostridium massiliamazoniense]
MNNKKSKSLLAYPYVVWSLIFIVAPIVIILVLSFLKTTNGQTVFSLDNYKKILNPIYLNIFLHSIILAFISTVLCLILGYPVAYIISKYNFKKRNILILLFILPMWMNFLIRTYAWMAILNTNGILNNILGIFGISPVKFLYTEGAVLLGMVYNFLPFMVIPIYTVLIKLDQTLIDASYDLGATKLQTFKKVILPLSLPGVISGITMVFMPAVSTFVISRLLGGSKYLLVGNLIEQEITAVGDWNLGSSLAIFMMILILISMAFMTKYEKKYAGKD